MRSGRRGRGRSWRRGRLGRWVWHGVKKVEEVDEVEEAWRATHLLRSGVTHTTINVVINVIMTYFNAI